MPRKNEARVKLKEKRRRDETRQRYIWIGIISILAIAIVAVLILVNNKPVGEIRPAAAMDRPQVNRNSMGDPNAPVKVEEFSDFQCPYCRLFFEEGEKNIVDNYVKTGKAYFTYSSFSILDPSTTSGESKDAAQAAYCAADQNKFWEFHDLLFTNQNGENIGDFTSKRLTAFAETLGLDAGAFKSCLSGNKYKQQVFDDLARGRSLGVKATPSFIVNGTLVEGYVGLSQAIDAALTK